MLVLLIVLVPFFLLNFFSVIDQDLFNSINRPTLTGTICKYWKCLCECCNKLRNDLLFAQWPVEYIGQCSSVKESEPFLSCLSSVALGKSFVTNLTFTPTRVRTHSRLVDPLLTLTASSQISLIRHSILPLI